MLTDARREICLAATSMFRFSAMHDSLQNQGTPVYYDHSLLIATENCIQNMT